MIIKNILIYTASLQGSLKILKKKGRKERREGTGEKISDLIAKHLVNNWFKRIKIVSLQ